MDLVQKMVASNKFEVECRRPDVWSGDKHTLAFLLENNIPTWKTLWTEEFKNLVVTEGLNLILESTLTGGTRYTSWYVGLKDTGTPAAGDTMASHPTWSTITPYSDVNDPAWTPGSVSGGSVDNSASKAAFNIDTTDDVYGAFLKTDNTKGGTAGKLYGAGDFAAARGVQSGDILYVTITATAAVP